MGARLQGVQVMLGGAKVDPASGVLELQVGPWMAYVLHDQGGRDEQEDAWRVLPFGEGGVLAVVADGMGGHDSGREASTRAVETFCRCLQVHATDLGLELPEDALRRAIVDAHHAVEQLPGSFLRRPGSTLTALFLGSPFSGMAHVGDSGAWSSHGRDWSRLSGLHRLERHRLTACLGASLTAREVGRRADVQAWGWCEAPPRPPVLLATDGLVGEEPLDRQVGETAHAYLQRLLEASRAAGCQDNATGVLVVPVEGYPLEEEAVECGGAA